MAYIELNGISKSYGPVLAVDNLSLNIEPGEVMSLLGPSGCGKTTTLNMIAGFLDPDAGDIVVNSKSIVSVPPHKRNTGMVFQNYALFPHMTVFGNIAFGLQMRKVSKDQIKSRVKEALELVRLGGMEERYPKQLSGGQQQRVALARALVIRPAVLLLDEPLSNLDAKLRAEMRVELREIQRRIGITTIFVTHDQEEALTLSDRLAVMNLGKIEQVGTPREIYDEPKTFFVAQFIGNQNFFWGEVEDTDHNSVLVRTTEDWKIVAAKRGQWAKGEKVVVMVRPEKMRLLPKPSEIENSFPVRFRDMTYLGAARHYYLKAAENDLTVISHGEIADIAASSGDELSLEWTSADSLLLKESTMP